MKKRIITLMMMLCMVFSICACGGDTDGKADGDKQNQNSESEDTSKENTDDTSKDNEDSTKVEYKIILVDEAGNPVSGAMVQICKDACVPAKTGEDGVAVFSLEETEGYKASIMVLPEGYVYEGEAEVYFENGATEVTLTVKAQ